MPEKFKCKFTKQELEKMYLEEGLTIKELCSIVGCKSLDTMAKILKSNGISTDSNARRGYQKRGNRTDEEFKDFLLEEYCVKRRSMSSIAKELHVSNIIISRYLDKYKIHKRTKSEQEQNVLNAGWKGGRLELKNGYVLIYAPDHPSANTKNYVYEHQLVVEEALDRYLRKGEVVHHIDFNKQNNDIENLVVLSNSDHARLHAMLRKGIPFEDAIKEVKVIDK